ncbi:MAG: ATP-binding protein, partial [Pseudomonadota bacterium]
MRLNRLTLTDFRGIGHRDIAFGPGITLVEGPNESGKSSLIEALRLLLDEPDTSKKQSVRSIQPVGRDVATSIAAELMIG